METKTKGIRYLSEHFEKVQGLMHYVNEESLLREHVHQRPKKASGVDKVTKEKYSENATENIRNLLERMKALQYRPLPVRRTYIPKANGKLRPLGILAYEDKLVQGVMADILNEVYEPRFLRVSYGFRPNRSQHDAIAKVNNTIMDRRMNWVLEADIKGFFDNVDQEILMKLLEQDIDDKNFLRYIKRFLKAGIVEDGRFTNSDRGTIQGGCISPILGNVYLHYALDTWFCRQINPRLEGDAEFVRFADDFIILFQYKEDAIRVMKVLSKRLGRFKLELAEDKTRVVHIGRNSTEKESFDFLGFTFYDAKMRNGCYRVGIRTSKKKLKQKKIQVKKWAKSQFDKPIHETMKAAMKALVGHYNYYGISGNSSAIQNFAHYVKCCIKGVLCRRSQRAFITWEKFDRIWAYYEVKPKITKDIWNWKPAY